MVLFFKKLFYKVLKRIWSRWYPALPQHQLEDKHISNCQVLTNRLALLDNLPKHGIVAELGVERGLFSKEIARRCLPSELHLVDTWTKEDVWGECAKNIQGLDAVTHKMLSTDYLVKVEPASLDWLYIDTDHTYKTSIKELKLAAKAIKKNGFICGHDYTSVAYSGLRKYGVVEAVNEFCVAQNFEIVYLTSETDRHLSYALRKL